MTQYRIISIHICTTFLQKCNFIDFHSVSVFRSHKNDCWMPRWWQKKAKKLRNQFNKLYTHFWGTYSKKNKKLAKTTFYLYRPVENNIFLCKQVFHSRNNRVHFRINKIFTKNIYLIWAKNSTLTLYLVWFKHM